MVVPQKCLIREIKDMGFDVEAKGMSDKSVGATAVFDLRK